MRLQLGVTARLVLTDGTTVQGTAARSGQWGVHRLDSVTAWDRFEPAKLAGYVLVDARRVLFAQIEPPDTKET